MNKLFISEPKVILETIVYEENQKKFIYIYINKLNFYLKVSCFSFSSSSKEIPSCALIFLHLYSPDTGVQLVWLANYLSLGTFDTYFSSLYGIYPVLSSLLFPGNNCVSLVADLPKQIFLTYTLIFLHIIWLLFGRYYIKKRDQCSLKSIYQKVNYKLGERW